jgi:hypothetical protein
MDELLSQDEVAKLLRVTTGTLANWRVEGKGPRYVKAGRIQYRRSDVAQYIENCVRSSTSEVAA